MKSNFIKIILGLLILTLIHCPTKKEDNSSTSLFGLLLLSGGSRSTSTGTGTGTGTGTTGSSPTISSVSPSTGVSGTYVTITGTNFSSVASSNTVKFNGTTATVTAATSTSLTATVPENATTGTISVTSNSLSATSSSSFTIATPTPLTLGANFAVGNLSADGRVFYSFSATADKYYTVYFDEGGTLSRSGTYTADITVNVFRANGTYLFGTVNNNYYITSSSSSSVGKATATETYYVEVKGSSATSSGTFGIRIGESLTWTSLTSGTSSNILSIACPGSSSTACVVVGASGLIRRTTDGNTWSTITPVNANQLNFITCPSATVCYAVGAGGTIIKSTDAGASWSALTSGIATAVTGISCLDTNNCFVSGAGGKILKTTDGNAWNNLTTGVVNDLYSIACASTTSCVSVGSLGRIVKTSDGTNWTSQTSSASSTFYNVLVKSTTEFIAFTGSILQGSFTTTNGTSWSDYYTSTGSGVAFGGAYCRSSAFTNCVAVSIGTSPSKIIRTTTGMEGWAMQYLNLTVNLNGAFCPTDTLCYAVGDSGTIVKGQ